jgi:hypothetical protein
MATKARRKAARKAARRSHAAKETTRRRKRRSSAAAEAPKRRRRSSRRRAAAAEPKRRKRRSSKRRRHKVKAHSVRRHRVRSHMSNETPKKRRRSRKRRSSGRRRLSMKKSAVAARRRRRSHAAAAESPKRRRRSSRKRRSSGRRHRVRGHTVRRRGRTHRVRAHLSRETPRKRRRSRRRSRRAMTHHRSHRRYSRRRSGAMENPLSGMEIAVGAVTGVVGFISADALDRVLATHALGASASGATGSDGKPLYGDTPTTTGAYAGLYNATAVLAPMNGWRWLAGAGITITPFVIAAFIKSPVGRSSLQFFGFGAGVRILGKAVTDLMAKFFGRTSWGARMYDGEARAAALKNGGDTSLYPTSGLGSLPTGVGSACNCANCTTGVGSCCRLTGSQALPPPAGVPQASGQPTNTVTPTPMPALPMPSPMPVIPPASSTPAPMPVPVTAPPMFTVPNGGLPNGGRLSYSPQPAPRQPIQGRFQSPPVFAPPPGSVLAAGTQGLPEGVGAPNGARKSAYHWGSDSDKAAE